MDPAVIDELVERARHGDERALSELFHFHQPRLVRMVELRLDAALRRRLDPTDVVQEAWLEVVKRFPVWREQAALPFSVWVRLTTAQALAAAQRRHCGAHMRDALREVPGFESRPSISAINVADAFLATATSPTQAAHREELRARVLAALEELDELDREIVALRHFEELTNDEVAVELAITPAAASKRLVRALVRLRPALESIAAERTGGGV